MKKRNYIWGRGALDVKNQVFGCLEAAEYLLSRGAALARTVYLAFGDDEETLRLGAKALAETLRSRGVRLAYVLDEGGGKIQCAADYGAPETYISPVGVMEKGCVARRKRIETSGSCAASARCRRTLSMVSPSIRRKLMTARISRGRTLLISLPPQIIVGAAVVETIGYRLGTPLHQRAISLALPSTSCTSVRSGSFVTYGASVRKRPHRIRTSRCVFSGPTTPLLRRGQMGLDMSA